MRIVIISDLHGNYDALRALPETYNEFWVLGGLVNNGPEPCAAVDFVKERSPMKEESTTEDNLPLQVAFTNTDWGLPCAVVVSGTSINTKPRSKVRREGRTHILDFT
jgi:hypothetical protein